MSRRINLNNLAEQHPKYLEYLVINISRGGQPTVAHGTRIEADEEAKRRAKANPGQMFTVAAVVASYMTSPTPVEYK